jgi:hypothetical protein
MIPMGLALGRNSKWLAVIAVAVLVAPLSAIAPLYAFVAAIPILFLFFQVCFKGRILEATFE